MRLHPASRADRRARGRCSSGSATPRSRRPRAVGDALAGRRSRSSVMARALVPRHPAADPRRAVGRARPGRGRQPVPGGRATSPPRACAVVYISHRLEEIREIGDRITVLKDGRTVATGLAGRHTPTSELIRLMTGRSIEYVFPARPEQARTPATPVLEVAGLARGRASSATSTSTVHAGEIVGLAGLVGAGRSRDRSRPCTAPAGPTPAPSPSTAGGCAAGRCAAAVGAGVGLCPEERKSQGLLLDQSVYRNITISSLARFARGGFLDRGEERRGPRSSRPSLDVRPTGVERAVRTLSGGNQQKVVLARWLLRECRVLLLDEPTRGVDVGARAEIYRPDPRPGRRRCGRRGGLQRGRGGARSLRPGARRARGHASSTRAPAAEIDESRVLDLVMEGRVA